MPSGPLVVAPLLPDSPQKKVAVDHLTSYEAKFGAGTITQFSGHAIDVLQILQRAVPVALKKAKPGTQEFRQALLEAVESEKEIPATHGVYNFTASDHAGLDNRGRVLLRRKGATGRCRISKTVTTRKRVSQRPAKAGAFFFRSVGAETPPAEMAQLSSSLRVNGRQA